MATTTFVNNVTLTDADWFNDVDRVVYDILADPADLAAMVATLGATSWTITGNLSVEGGTTIGNATGDAFTINPSAWTLANAVTITGTWANLGAVTTVDINGGTIDATAIGGGTPAAGAFTTLSATKAASGDVLSLTTGEVGSESLFAYIDANTAALFNVASAGAGRNGIQFNPTNLIFEIAASTVATISSTGLAVTGTISNSAATGTTSVTSTTGTNVVYSAFINTGGTYYVGVDDSAGGSFAGTAYSFFRYAPPGRVIQDVIAGTGAITTVSSTGLAVTGTLSSTGNLTVSGGTITTGSTTALSLATSGGAQAQVVNVASAVNYVEFKGSASASGPQISARGSDTNVSLGFDTQGNGAHIFFTGTTASIQAIITHTASAVNYLNISGGATGTPPYVYVEGSDTNIGLDLVTKGTGDVRVITGGYATQQLLISHTASATRFITLTGSNGGNPTIGTSAGNLALSSAIVLPASTTSVASANLPHGSAPTAPVDGDMWTTTAGLYVRINGSTVGPLS